MHIRNVIARLGMLAIPFALVGFGCGPAEPPPVKPPANAGTDAHKVPDGMEPASSKAGK